MAGVAAAVFATPELLENILLQMASTGTVTSATLAQDMSTLIHYQRVNKTFKATIDRSWPLQTLLFRRQKRLANDQLPLFLSLCRRIELEDNENINQLLLDRAVMIDLWGSTITLLSSFDSPYEPTILLCSNRAQPIGKAKAIPVTGSWRGMMLAQPPFPLFIRWENIGCTSRCKFILGNLEYKAGVTLGEVVDHCLKSERQDDNGRNEPDERGDIPNM
ncbi:hypothetical protein LTR78_002053 [Recurvomyces mirabilis]|uniref:Uncharacterized protein n=1 Tax=Recurvomyces mirabilis TaxID=574656 RepID=A0AAE1C4S4_9PEZI|nr:hypothetical protein LTR78_002053 [Recurvomyces mirabilis]KAK5160511.1 hypothetical protein LTS14_001523 [Recurvomyces mirabilis]